MLGSFQKTVLIVALVVLILGLSIVAVMLVASASDAKWPPYSGTCPDYWNLEDIPDGDGAQQCVNQFKLGMGKNIPACKKFTPQTGSGSGCTKYNYSNACKVTWDGITNSSSLKKNC